MIRYNPPKSQVWGHQVGRLAAIAIVERCATFLETQCAIVNAQPSELMIGWNAVHHEIVSEIVAEVDHTLGQPTTVNEMPSASGLVFRQRRWPFAAENLPAVAAWFDRLAELLKTQHVVAQSSTFWMLAWRDSPPPLRPLESPGGMLGIHLGRPHRVTTMFTFHDLGQYETIKAALANLGLLELSDKHLRPKKGGTTAGQQAK